MSFVVFGQMFCQKFIWNSADFLVSYSDRTVSASYTLSELLLQQYKYDSTTAIPGSFVLTFMEIAF